MSSKYHKLLYWFLLKPNISVVVVVEKGTALLGGAFGYLSRHVTLIQEPSALHQGWFKSDVNTITETDWLLQEDPA